MDSEDDVEGVGDNDFVKLRAVNRPSSRGSIETPDTMFRFNGKVWVKINLGYCIYPKYSHPFLLHFTSCECMYYCWMSGKQCRA